MKLFKLITIGFIIISGILMYSCQNKEKTVPESADSSASEQQLKDRSSLDPKYTWNLTDLYENDEAWEKDFKWIKDNLAKYKSFEGKLGNSAAALVECLKFDEQIGIKFDKVRLYSSLAKDLDMNETNYQAMYSRVQGLSADIISASSYIKPELLSIDDNKLRGFISGNEELKVYAHFFDNLLRGKAHTLDKSQEEMMALAGPMTETPYNVYGLMKNADMKYPTVKNEKGEDTEVTPGLYYSAIFSTDRDFRKRVYEAIYVPYDNYRNTMGALFSGNVKALMFNAKARNYKNTREASLSPNNIPTDVYDNLVKTVNDNLEQLHRWGSLKKRVLGLDELHPYDTYVTLFPGSKKDYSYEEAKEIILKALAPMGEDYINNLKRAFDNRWIDVYETKGKRAGAYSTGSSYGNHPYVLLNWSNQLNDVFTLAHEMGHNMHSYYTEQNQPYIYADYPIFLAEVASITNEALLHDYLIKNAETKEEKMALMETYLFRITSTFYRQTRFAEFEQIIHERMEQGEALTPDSLCAVYGEMYKKYWGSDMVMDPQEAYTWARVHHFYYGFYVYQYATGLAAAEALAAQILSEGQTAVDRYMSFLKAGKSDYAINILQKAGVDMTKPEPILAVVNKMKELLDDLEKIK